MKLKQLLLRINAYYEANDITETKTVLGSMLWTRLQITSVLFMAKAILILIS